MNMDIDQFIPEETAVELTGKSADTLKRWRHGRYFRHKTGGIWYFSDKRKLTSKKIADVWYYDRRDLELWNAAINERTGTWRRG